MSSHASSDSSSVYYVPASSHWPIVGAIGLFLTAYGFATSLNHHPSGQTIMNIGLAVVLVMVWGWFSDVISESIAGKYNAQVDASFRWGMGWFIFSEVMFFAAFFGALFYARQFSVPWLGGDGSKGPVQELIWPAFDATWPLLKLPSDTYYGAAKEVVGPWGLPLVNTLLLLSSGVTVTWAHWGLMKNNRQQLIVGLALTVLLGIIFVYCQALEYGHAMHEFNLTLNSGIYGATFYMLTGFHGFHVTLGALMLAVILVRSMMGHFSAENHFAFEAVAWYWHFVDVVWLGLFIFVYWL
jgi:cytochrome c oxidase subunit III